MGVDSDECGGDGSSNHDNKEPHTSPGGFKAGRDDLKHWPYSINKIEETLDTNLIAWRGQQLLFQAANIGELYAFVGTGVPISYGRLSWSGLTKFLNDRVDEFAKAYLRCTKAASKCSDRIFSDPKIYSRVTDRNRLEIRIREIDFVSKEIETLYETFRAIKERGGNLGDSYPIKLQTSERLYLTIKNKVGLFREHDSDGEHEFHQTDELFDPEFVYRDKENPIEVPSPVRQASIELKQAIRDLQDLFDPSLGTSASFASLNKSLLVDERAHAELILREIVKSDWSVGRAPRRIRDANQKLKTHPNFEVLKSTCFNALKGPEPSRALPAIRDDPERYAVLGFFRVKGFLDLARYLRTETETHKHLFSSGIEKLDQNFQQTLSIVCEYLEVRKKRSEEAYISPTHRFLLGMVMAVHKDPVSYKKYSKYVKAPGRRDLSNRSVLIDENLDPLEKVSRGLQISRFITTNYDMEIERLFQDRGYAIVEQGEAKVSELYQPPTRVSGLGRILRDNTFERERACDLVTFMLDQNSSDASIFHLHGRATAGNSIVLTERDYMDLYLQDDGYRESIDEAVKLAFGSKTLFFIGLGMTEEDILRPLRQFMSNRDRQSKRRAIVLLPAQESEKTRAQFSASLYVRYGVHATYFGRARIRLSCIEEQESIDLDWLHLFLELLWGVHEVLQEAAETLTKLCEEISKPEAADLTNLGTPKSSALNVKFDGPNEGFVSAEVLINEDELLSNLKTRLGSLSLKNGASKIEQCALSALFGVKDITKEALVGDTSPQLAFASPSFLYADMPGAAISASGIHEPLKLERALVLQFLKGALHFKFSEMITSDGEADDAALAEKAGAKIRHLRSMLIGLEGIYNATLTGALCATLDVVSEQSKAWIKNWRMPPYRRHAHASYKPIEEPGALRVHDRHKIRPSFGIPGIETRPGDGLIYPPRKKGPSFDTRQWGAFGNFLEALESANGVIGKSNDEKPFSRRRLFLLTAPRGGGKGGIQYHFARDEMFKQFVTSSWACEPRPVYTDSIFLNFSFSAETASAWDKLANAVVDACLALRAATTPDEKRESIDQILEGIVQKKCEGAGDSDEAKWLYDYYYHLVFEKRRRDYRYDNFKDQGRLEVLMGLFDAWASLSTDIMKESKEPAHRIIVCLISTDLLHYANGHAKNREIYDLLDMLVSHQTRHVPMDVILISGESRLPDPLRRPRVWRGDATERDVDERSGSLGEDYPSTYLAVDRANIWPSGKRDVEQRMRYLTDMVPSIKDLNLFHHSTDGEIFNFVRNQLSKVRECEHSEHPSKKCVSEICIIHFLRPAAPETIMINHFPFLAVSLLFLHSLPEDYLKQKSEPANSEKERKLLGTLARIGGPPENMSGDQSEDEKVELPGGFFEGEVWKKTVEPLSQTLAQVQHEFAHDDNEEADWRYLRQVLQSRYLLTDDRMDGITAGDEWRQISSLLGYNQYLTTLLLQVASDIVKKRFSEKLPKGDENSFRRVVDGARKAEDFIREITDALMGGGDVRREEIVLQYVIDYYEAYHNSSRPQDDQKLQQVLLRHLAVIGSPCSADVLVRTPEVRAYLQKNPRVGRIRWTDDVQLALGALSRRGLVFEFEPNETVSTKYFGGTGTTADKFEGALAKVTAQLHDELKKLRLSKVHPKNTKLRRYGSRGNGFRYSLHRTTRSHIIQKLGGGVREQIETNSFSPTLFASMPSDLPRPTYEAYGFLKTLLSSLSQYPDRSGSDDQPDHWHYSTADETTSVQALRASLGVVRSAFSIAVVSRFEDYKFDRGGAPLPFQGYFEEYRTRVRWILRKAWQMPDRDNPPLSQNEQISDVARNRLHALYIDEIVWICNECGVVSLVQGDMLEAIEMFRDAIEVNKKIEGRTKGGPMYNHLSLNLAIAQIARGKLTSAKRRLAEIRRTENQGNQRTRLYYIALGYTGLIRLIEGDSAQAIKRFEKALNRLRDRYRDKRAWSIFARHLSDAHRGIGKFEEAMRYVDEANKASESGGHEDLRMWALLSKLKLQIRSVRAERGVFRQADNARFVTQLRRLSEYAQIMEMPSLACAVDIVRANMLYQQGESTRSGALAMRAIRTASANGMLMRQCAAMTVYARVLNLRGLDAQARTIAFASLEIAKSLGHQIEISRAERTIEALG